MKMIAAVVLLTLWIGFPLQAFDSALAPYPWLKESFGPDVDRVLSRILAAAPASGAFRVAVDWSANVPGEIDRGRDSYGPLSGKCFPNWHEAADGAWRSGSYVLEGMNGNFVLQKPADGLSSDDWWQKEGESIVSRRFSQDWPNIWCFHHDALESGLLGYCEGLGLVLWAFQPGEFLRRADHLEVGESREIAGKTYSTLVATPSWIKTKLSLANRTTYPFNESTLISWAPHRPVVTYFIDPAGNNIVGAEFVYHRVLRSGPKDWEAGSAPSGLMIRTLAEEVAQTPGGLWYPSRIVSEVERGGELLRQITMSVTYQGAPEVLVLKELPAGKRTKDPWPKYRPEVYERLIREGDQSHATRVGLAAALAYEGRMSETEEALSAAVAALEADETLLPETFGGIDWELGSAVYELFSRYSDAELSFTWQSCSRTATWSAILARGVNLYQQYCPTEPERIELLRGGYEETFETSRRAEVERMHLEAYRERLEADIAEQRLRGRDRIVAHLEGLLGEVENEIRTAE